MAHVLAGPPKYLIRLTNEMNEWHAKAALRNFSSILGS